MDLGAYRPVLANRDTRNALLLGFLIRVPMWAGGVILTLHVVSSLGRAYGAAGLVTAASTVAIAVSGPWRGRLLDRIGLRRTVGPSLVVQVVCWSIAPWVGYAPLVAFAALAGLFVVPTFSILRQVIIRSVPSEQRRTALSLDSSATEPVVHGRSRHRRVARDVLGHGVGPARVRASPPPQRDSSCGSSTLA